MLHRLWNTTRISALALALLGAMALTPAPAFAHGNYYAPVTSRFYNTPMLNNNPYRMVRSNRYVRPCQTRRNGRYNRAQRFYNNGNRNNNGLYLGRTRQLTGGFVRRSINRVNPIRRYVRVGF